MTEITCVFTDCSCDCVKQIFIRKHGTAVAVYLLTVHVTVLNYYLNYNIKGRQICVY